MGGGLGDEWKGEGIKKCKLPVIKTELGMYSTGNLVSNTVMTMHGVGWVDLSG